MFLQGLNIISKKEKEEGRGRGGRRDTELTLIVFNSD
jgi:hypothetical protein